VIVLGGGVIGLSIARTLLQRGCRVTVLERDGRHGQASWAGAGILAPGHAQASAHPLDRMAGAGSSLHEQWARELLAETGIDNGFRPCGGVYIAQSLGEAVTLRCQMAEWAAEQIESVPLDATALRDCLGPGFQPVGAPLSAWRVNEESQVRPPRHLAALAAAIRLGGGRILALGDSATGTISPVVTGNRVRAVCINDEQLDCDWLCLAAGSWSGALAKQLGWNLPVVPVRGQMVLFKTDAPLFQPVVNAGSRYLVPRDDGHVLAGSTMEEAGFDPSTTAEAVASLTGFAARLFPALDSSRVVRSWAGLRPATFDGMPCIGFVPGFGNCLVATGHLRSGLQLSPATAVMIADLLEGRQVDEDWQKLFSPSRRLDRPA
jgi:glycine oxidase